MVSLARKPRVRFFRDPSDPVGLWVCHAADGGMYIGSTALQAIRLWAACYLIDMTCHSTGTLQ